MKRSFQLRIRTPRLELTYLEGRALLDLSLERPLTRKEEKWLRQSIQALHDEKNGLATVYAGALECGHLAARDRPAAARAFASLATNFSQKGMKMHAAGALIRQGQLSSRERGAQVVEEQVAELRRLGVKDTEAFTNLLVPRIDQGTS